MLNQGITLEHVHMTKPEMILQNSPFYITFNRWIVPLAIALCIIIVTRQLIRTDFAFDLYFFLQNGMLVFSTYHLFYIGRTTIKERLIFNASGIRYQSGSSLLKSSSGNDWFIHWENIQKISVIQIHNTKASSLSFTVRQCQRKEYDIQVFRWVDSKTLDTTHKKIPNKMKVLDFERFKQGTVIPPDEFDAAVTRTPIYQYLTQHHQTLPIKIVPIKPRIKITQRQQEYLWLFVLFVVVLVSFPTLSRLFNDLEYILPKAAVPARLYPATKSYPVPSQLHATWKQYNEVHAVAFSPDGRFVASGGEDERVYFWKLETEQQLKVFSGHHDRIQTIEFHPHGQLLASGSEDDTIRLWNIETGELETKLKGHAAGLTWYQGIYDLAFSPDGQYLASASWDGSVRVWDLEAKQRLWLAKGGTAAKTGHKNSVSGVAFSPNGQYVASAGFDYTIRLWDATTGQQLRVLRGHDDWVMTVAFSPNSRLLASGSYDNSIRIHDLETERTLQVIRGHNNSVSSLAFSADNQILISASDDKVIRYWEVATGHHIKTLKGHNGYVNDIAFSPDNKTLVSASSDDTIRVWVVE